MKKMFLPNFMLRIKFWLILVGVSAGVGFSLSATISEVFQNNAPSLAAQAWPQNGFALNALADAKLNEIAAIKANSPTSNKIQDFRKNWNSIDRIALSAFTKEPLNASAWRSMAMSAEANGNKTLASKLMGNAIKFSRRDTAANNWQLQQSLGAQNLREAMRLVDRILREDNGLRARYLPILVTGVSQPEGLNAIYPLLLKKPAWEREFWAMAASQNSAPAELATLRKKLSISRNEKTPTIPFTASDTALLKNLVRNSHFEEAESLHGFLAGTSNYVNGGGREIKYDNFIGYNSPFDWQLTSQGEVQSYANDNRESLAINMDGKSVGKFAGKLISLENGRFRLQIVSQQANGVEFFVRLKCLDKNKLAIAIDMQKTNRFWTAEQKENLNCQWYMLELFARNDLNDSNFINIHSISIS